MAMERTHENIFSSLTLNFPLFMPTHLKEGLQSHRVSSDFRQQVSLALERQLSGQLVNSYASSLINIPVTTQGSTVPSLNTLPNFPSKSSAKHPPLIGSNSVANCNAASHLKTLAAREHRKLDRSISEPVDKSLQTLKQAPPNSSRYKTELCRPFEESGTCKYGDKCQFAHGMGELRTLTRHPKYKTELCRTFHTTGFCPYGPRCHFIHNSEDSKKCLLNTLQGPGNLPVNGNPNLSPTSLSPHMSPKEYDICGFSIGSAGELSPTNSSASSTSSSSGSPTSSLGGFFLDDSHASYLPQVPQTAPPTLSKGRFFGADYVPLKPLSALPSLIPTEFTSQGCTQEELISTLDTLVSELELDSLGEVNSNADSSSKPESSAAVDINRNIRLPIFSRLSLGSSP
ncbi:mRNA decay activator protein ZFP36L1 [Trichonephila clavata]|uniref:mRNA decay activator protein ZFP36L1 n=1 Tax=Trichonephila clavata TaxID=2740835 RepID=A0A8X6KGL7_TRICU|nr:mRNA decay activator protein ZFP36L1 [Trichonephila clavata]